MGSGTSKARRFGSDRSSSSSFSSSSAAPSGSICSRSSTSSRRRHRARSLFQSSCLGSSSRACDSDDEEADAKICNDLDDGQVRAPASGINLAESDPHEVAERCQKLKVEHSNEMPAVPSNSVDLGEWIQASNVNNSTRGIESPSPGSASSGHSLNLSSRFLSHFSFIPGSVSFRLGRASSLGSGREFPVCPEQSPTVNDSEQLQSENSRIDSVDGHDNPGNRNLRTRHFSSSMTRNHLTNVNGNLWRNHQTASLSNTPRNYGLRLGRDSDVDNSRSRSYVEIDNLNARYGDWRTGSREPMDHNVQFSRTLSVGRLRDRVLRRPSFSDLTLSPLQRDTTRNDSIEDESGTGALISLGPDYPLYGATSHGNETLLQSRESRLHNVLQNRSNFLERRRRIRSQVRALERLGSRSETISRHERSCILSGRHRPGQCTCHMNGRESNPNNDGGARASISRIVMLAEALFEVLDEIHQQAVALSSRPSVSSIGSVPAPSEVVESLPVKIYSKSTRLQTEEVAQCYICLIEYEEGDSMRILPCHHEFHRSCIDKWLKEIHRVCPLCRGDICCRSGS